MESQETPEHEVIISDTAEIRFYEILDYLYDHYPLEKAEQIAGALRDKAKSLCHYPKRGVLERHLENREREYRYILFKRVARAGIKIIYYLDTSNHVVYVVDFFPTEMDDNKIVRE